MGQTVSGQMGDLARRMVQEVESRNPEVAATARLQQAWRKSMDQSVLDHTCVVYAIPGTEVSEVIVYVDSNIWATELNLQSELLRLKLNLSLKDLAEQEGRRSLGDPEKIKKLKFLPSKNRYRAPENVLAQTAEQLAQEGPLDVEPLSLTEEEEEEIKRQVDVIEDEQVRQAAFDALKSAYELQKGIDAHQQSL